jgi:hypothetical protein
MAIARKGIVVACEEQAACEGQPQEFDIRDFGKSLAGLMRAVGAQRSGP